MTKNDTKFCMEQICRICLKTEDEMVILFYGNKVASIDGMEHTIEDMYNKVTGAEAENGDGLPELICCSCFERLESAFQFREQCLKSEIILRDYKFRVDIDLKKDIIELAEDEKLFTEDGNLTMEFDELHKQNLDSICVLTQIVDNPEESSEQLQESTNKYAEKSLKLPKTTCNVCFESFPTVLAKKRHLKSHLNYLNSNEVNIFNEKSDIEKNVESLESDHPEPTKLFVCKYDVNVLSEKLDIEKNVDYTSKSTESEHPEPAELFLCKYCPRKFKTSVAVSRHVKNHEIALSNEMFICELCDKVYKNVHVLNRHKKNAHQLKIEKTITPFLCSYCGKTLATKGSLKLHMKGHEGHKVFKCDYCDKTFYASFTKLIHERIHTNETPYICSYCGQKFKASGSLKVHVRKHTGDLPHKCLIENCNKAFAQSSELKMHIRSNHTGERDYQCSECDKNFITKQHLKQHFERNHAPKPTEKNFMCYVCNNAYFTKQSVTKHLKQVHKITKYSGHSINIDNI